MISQSKSPMVVARFEVGSGHQDGVAGAKTVAAPSLIEGVPLLCSATLSRRRMSVIRISDDGAVRTLTLDRPDQRNALNVPTIRALRVALGEAETAAVRCLVLTGAGKAFCAGADIAEWAEAEARGELATFPWTSEMHGLVAAVAEFPRPTIALLNGAAVGAGLDLALACDFRFAADTARFQCAYTRMGYAPDAGGSWLLPRIIGLEQAKRFAFTGEFWSAPEALVRGLVTEVHPV